MHGRQGCLYRCKHFTADTLLVRLIIARANHAKDVLVPGGGGLPSTRRAAAHSGSGIWGDFFFFEQKQQHGKYKSEPWCNANQGGPGVCAGWRRRGERGPGGGFFFLGGGGEAEDES